MEKEPTKIEVNRNGVIVDVNPEDLTLDELCQRLDYIQIDSDSFIPDQEIDEGYAVIEEAIRRLRDGVSAP
jgi:hypothetical protein